MCIKKNNYQKFHVLSWNNRNHNDIRERKLFVGVLCVQVSKWQCKAHFVFTLIFKYVVNRTCLVSSTNFSWLKEMKQFRIKFWTEKNYHLRKLFIHFLLNCFFFFFELNENSYRKNRCRCGMKFDIVVSFHLSAIKFDI